MKKFIAAGGALAVCSTAAAYPIVIGVNAHLQLQGIARNELIAFAPNGKGEFERVPVQVDELEDDRLLVLRQPSQVLPVREKLQGPAKKDPFKGNLSKYHRLVIDDSGFGKCDPDCEKTIAKKQLPKNNCQKSATPVWNGRTWFTWRACF